jgi:hypothetical protein
VSSALDGLGPPDRLLHLVDHQDGPLGTGSPARRLPLLGDPFRPAQGRLVGAGEPHRHPLDDVSDHRRLPHLPWAGHDLYEAALLGQAPGENSSLVANVRHRITHGIE